MQEEIGNPAIEKFFRDYENNFNNTLNRDPDVSRTVNFFADGFMAVGPSSAVWSRNDEQFRHRVSQGYKFYRTSGLRFMKIVSATHFSINELHVLSTIQWNAIYEVSNRSEIISFVISYLLQLTPNGPRIICYITGDEEAELKKRGIPPATQVSASFHFQNRFVVSTGKEMKMLQTAEVAYFFTENKMVYLVAFTGDKFGTEYTLEQLEQVLDSKHFFRINRKFIVNIGAIAQLANASKSRIKLSLEPVSRYDTTTSFKRTAKFRKWLAGER